MSIKLKEVVFLKTTAEPVFTLAFNEPSDMVSVRRPIQSRDGIRHEVEQFSIDELETEAEGAARMATSYKLRQSMIIPEAQPEISSVRN
jgi:hypothetical protein